MGKMSEHIGNQLNWERSSNEYGYDLRDKDVIIGSILLEGKFLSNDLPRKM
jgi:hypothetical protein